MSTERQLPFGAGSLISWMFLVAGFDLVIFDCDGVLLDSEIIACRADAEAYTSLGYPITTEEISKRFAGMPDEAVDAALAKEMGQALPEGFRSEIKKSVIEKYRTELCAIDGAAALLSTLGIAKCIASSAAPAKLALGLIETEMFELLYPNIFSTSLVEKGKPHPDIFLYAADAMGVEPARCVVIEDSVAGVTAAKSAGMTCIGFTGGSHCAEGQAACLLEAGAATVVERLNAVTDYIE